MDQQKQEELKKKVDEAWKNTINKNGSADKTSGAAVMPEASFGLFISGLMMEALIALGEMEHPISKKKESNIAHAKFIIDTLSMLKEKTKNNLDKAESGSLDAILYNLRMAFVNKSAK